MGMPNRIVLLRHGETVGESSSRFSRFWGTTDVPLSDRGRAQVRAAALELPGDSFERVFTSPLSRAWESARIVAPWASPRLLQELREIDFGDWEGLTGEEISAANPIRYEDWQQQRPGFEFPRGERRADFEARIQLAVAEILECGLSSVLVVAHDGVIRTIARAVTGKALERGVPKRGGLVQLTRDAGGHWFVGRRASFPNLTAG